MTAFRFWFGNGDYDGR